MPPKPTVIDKQKVLVVEGRDEEGFFTALLRHMSISLKYINIADYQIICVGGKDNFRTEIPDIIRRPGFSAVHAFAIIRDADNSSTSAFQSIRDILQRDNFWSAGVPVSMNSFSNGVPRTGIFIMPGNSDQGMLEDLCLETVKDDDAMPCVESFHQCVLSVMENPPKNPAKSKAQAFLATRKDYIRDIGTAAQQNPSYWNFNAECLADLKGFLEEFGTMEEIQ